MLVFLLLLLWRLLYLLLPIFLLLPRASLVAQLVKNLPAMQETLVQFLGQEDCWRRDSLPTPVSLGFPGGSASKESACNVGDLDSIPRLGRSPGEGDGYPLQYSGLGNSTDCIVHGVPKSNWVTFIFTLLLPTFEILGIPGDSQRVIVFIQVGSVMVPPGWSVIKQSIYSVICGTPYHNPRLVLGSMWVNHSWWHMNSNPQALKRTWDPSPTHLLLPSPCLSCLNFRHLDFLTCQMRIKSYIL